MFCKSSSHEPLDSLLRGRKNPIAAIGTDHCHGNTALVLGNSVEDGKV